MSKSLVLFKFVFHLLCSIGLIYQTAHLLIPFVKGKTIVSMEVGSSYHQTLPAITVCYSQGVSMDRLVTKEEYEKFFYNNLESDVNLDILFNMTIPFHHGRFFAIDLFDMTGEAKNLNRTEFTRMKIINEDDYQDRFIITDDFQPIESVIVGDGFGEIKKCFTLFSSLDKQFR